MTRLHDVATVRCFGVAIVTIVALTGCGEDLPRFPSTPRDLGIECTPFTSDADGGAGPGEATGCEAGQVCLQGRCYAECASDGDCSAAEQCREGACVVRTMPRPDMGPPDLGMPDLCAGVMCSESSAPFCDPRTGDCIECRTSDDCGAAAPVCDVAFGVCRAFVPAQCAPCKIDADCRGAIGTFDARCVQRDVPFERVCIALCGSDGSCPQGTACDTASNRCLPRIGSCTTFFAASQRRACAMDGDCAPRGATPDDFLFPMSCRANVCAAPCATSVECFDAAQSCDAMFCTP